MAEGHNLIRVSHGSHPIKLILINDIPFGYAPLSTAIKIFDNMINDKRVQLAQDLGHTPNMLSTVDGEDNKVVIFESPTRSVIWSGKRVRCKLEMMTIKDLTTFG